ncbi:TPA: antiviral reverse transcriptase Drt3b [Aeromonas hydrophila]
MAKVKIKLKKRDFHRALITDVLPYEVPFILTNEGFYREASNTDGILYKDPILRKVFIEHPRIDTIPLEFRIAKDGVSERKLYLIHPNSQLDIVKLYGSYNQLICHLCSRSSFSLRYPSKIAHSYYSKEHHEKTTPDEKFKDEGVSIDSINEPVYASTFFEYKNVGFLYKFYDSYDFHRIEKKFNHQFKFDIAKCFDSISTFQLSMSLRDISSYKQSKGLYSFENEYESIMNRCFNGNSHGIVIGPEFSRIFSEILLQSIDVEIKRKLENYTDAYNQKKPIYEHTHYVIKRYVDDYFLFYNDVAIKKIVHSVVIDELSKFRLYCNESKSKDSNVPFITGVTIAKQELSSLLGNFFTRFEFFKEDERGYTSKLDRYYKISNQLITDIKCIVYNNSTSYSSITGYFFTLVRSKISSIHEQAQKLDGNDVQCGRLTNFLLILIDISFFVYSMDYRVRSTYLISQIVVMINSITKHLDLTDADSIKKKIYDEAYLSIKSAHNKNSLRNIESLNLLIAIRDVDIDYQLPAKDIEKIIGLDKAILPCYFNLMTCLFYIQNKRNYLTTRNKVMSVIKEKFNCPQVSIRNDSELAHLFFDSIRCPYLTDRHKFEITDLALNHQLNLKVGKKNIEDIVNSIKSYDWFIDWNLESSDSIERLLMKKELKSPYGN